jgi:3-oxoacyl-[acyl-carrier-protein] synthase-3
MTQSRLEGVRVTGVTSVVPSGVRSIQEDADIFDLSDSQIKRLQRDIGIDKRHVTVKEECASDLCEFAAKLLLSELKYDPLSIDGLLLVTQTPDYFQPATSCVLHGRLELGKDCATFDINLGCSGYVYGLWLASMMIATGACKRVLMLAGDTISRCVSPYDRSVAPLFGDAGSATMIEKGADDSAITFVMHTDGKGYKHLIVPAGGFRNRSSRETNQVFERQDGNLRREEHLYMNGAEIFTFSIKEVPSLINEALAASNWLKDEVDYFVLHQANKFIIQNIVKKLGASLEKAPHDVFAKYGNQSSASIPVTICENFSSVLKDRSMKMILAGFGTGLSWAACALSLGPMQCSPVIVAK